MIILIFQREHPCPMFCRPELPLKQKNNRKKSSCLLFSLIDYLNEETKKKKTKTKTWETEDQQDSRESTDGFTSLKS